jgi:hypothetical protein
MRIPLQGLKYNVSTIDLPIIRRQASIMIILGRWSLKVESFENLYTSISLETLYLFQERQPIHGLAVFIRKVMGHSCNFNPINVSKGSYLISALKRNPSTAEVYQKDAQQSV